MPPLDAWKEYFHRDKVLRKAYYNLQIDLKIIYRCISSNCMIILEISGKCCASRLAEICCHMRSPPFLLKNTTEEKLNITILSSFHLTPCIFNESLSSSSSQILSYLEYDFSRSLAWKGLQDLNKFPLPTLFPFEFSNHCCLLFHLELEGDKFFLYHAVRCVKIDKY